MFGMSILAMLVVCIGFYGAVLMDNKRFGTIVIGAGGGMGITLLVACVARSWCIGVATVATEIGRLF